MTTVPKIIGMPEFRDEREMYRCLLFAMVRKLGDSVTVTLEDIHYITEENKDLSLVVDTNHNLFIGFHLQLMNDTSGIMDIVINEKNGERRDI